MSQCYILLVLGSLTEEVDFSHRLLMQIKKDRKKNLVGMLDLDKLVPNTTPISFDSLQSTASTTSTGTTSEDGGMEFLQRDRHHESSNIIVVVE
jgi:hypothetical protein